MQLSQLFTSASRYGCGPRLHAPFRTDRHACSTRTVARLPIQDPTWKAAYDELGAVKEQLSKAAIQNPLEYRALAMAAVQIGSRPHDLGADPEQAFAFCNRFMS